MYNAKSINVKYLPLLGLFRLIKNIRINDGDECWHYKNVSADGYGRVSIENIAYKAHRISYQIFIGEIDEDKVIDHICKNKSCVNPEHLDQVFQFENVYRGDSIASQNKKKTECIRGHKLIGQNVRIATLKNGIQQRSCRICTRLAHHTRKAKRLSASK